jgi:type I restriction enzyme, S subunit
MSAKRGAARATPRLRFPGFDAGWKKEPLASHLEECGFKVAATTSIPIYSSSRTGLIPQSSYYDGHTLANEGEYGVVPPNAFVYRHMSDDGRFVFNINDTGSEIAVSKEYPVFRTRDLSSRFLLALLNGSPAFKAFALSQKSGGTRTRLYFSKLGDWATFLPSVTEQDKIADCLTSLDEVIAAQGRKVEALKAHKRGLMQQLFPQEGKTRPRLRFPEFRDAPDWQEARLSSLGRLISGLTYSPSEVRGEGLLVLRSSNVQNAEIALEDNVYVVPDVKGANLAQPNDILICVRNGSKALIGKSALLPENMPICTHGAFMTMLRAHVPKFAFQLLQSASFFKQVAADLGATINSINGAQLLRYRFLVPKGEEQLRIADFLSSLDRKIAAESKQLAALKTHKQGLLQQLFPAPQAAEA